MGSFGDMIIFKVMRVSPLSFCVVFLVLHSICETSSLSFCFTCQGRIKHIHENMPKNAIELSPKFDCHLSKSANRVTSLLSYRAFELTQVNANSYFYTLLFSVIVLASLKLRVLQQYFFEFAFDEIKPRPRHVCPYAVVSFQYKGKEVAASPMAAHRYVVLQEMVTPCKHF